MRYSGDFFSLNMLRSRCVVGRAHVLTDAAAQDESRSQSRKHEAEEVVHEVVLSFRRSFDLSRFG